MGFIRHAAVAGQFYPDDAEQLTTMVEGFLDEAKVYDTAPPKALIAPHAGLVYSGAIAASAYVLMKPARDIIKRVILLGPCHRVAVSGLALSGADAFATPLGNVEVDRQATEQILGLAQVEIFDETHELEHSLEVHLPFLQVVLNDFKVVPIIVGEATPEQVAEVLEALWGGAETLIVISSDLSHFLDYDNAKALDGDTCRAIENLDPASIDRTGACGRFPVGGLLDIAKKRGLTATTLDIRNSGDTAGAKDRVVGYGSWMFTEPVTESEQTSAPAAAPVSESDFEDITRNLLKEHGANLLLLAALAIDYGLDHDDPIDINLKDHAEDLQADGACFVTLKKSGELRGCIGSPQACRPLAEDVAHNAHNAAFADPRFPKLLAEERDEVEISISVLSPPVPMEFENEADFINQIRPGIDGLIIEELGLRALFLPSVWSQLPAPEDFVGRLKMKAGMKQDHWSENVKVMRFIAEEVSLSDFE